MKLLSQIKIEDYFDSPFGKASGGKTIGDLISLILKGSFVVAGLIILFLFIFAGVSMIIGAGQNDPEKAKKGQQAITSALIGFVIIFVAYWVVRLIEVITGIPFITNPGF